MYMVQCRYLMGTQKWVGKRETGSNLIGYNLGLWRPVGVVPSALSGYSLNINISI